LAIRHARYEVIDSSSISLSGGKRCEVIFEENAVKVMDCHRFGREERLEICSYIHEGLSGKGIHERSIQSLEAELAFHAYCYRLGIEREHSKDADLDVKEDPRWYVVAGYSLLEVLGA
jgi:hypothetical protein